MAENVSLAAFNVTTLKVNSISQSEKDRVGMVWPIKKLIKI